MNDHMTAAEYQEYRKTGKLSEEKKHKYNAKKTEFNGKKYPSQHEANRAAELQLLLKAGEIVNVIEQVPFKLSETITYIADFVILNKDGTYIVEDAKGVMTDVYKLKKRLFREKYGFDIREV